MTGDCREAGRRLDVEGRAPRRALVRERPSGLLGEGGRVEAHELARLPAREVEKAADEARGPEGLALDLLDERPPGIVARRLVEEKAREPRDARERRIHFVRDAGRQRAESREALAVGERAFEARGLGGVVEDEDAGAGSRTRAGEGRDGDVEDARPRAEVCLEPGGRPDSKRARRAAPPRPACPRGTRRRARAEPRTPG